MSSGCNNTPHLRAGYHPTGANTMRPKRGSSVLGPQPTKVYRRRGAGGTAHHPEEAEGTVTDGTVHAAAVTGSPVAAEGSTHHQGPSPAAGVSQSQMWVPKKGSALGSMSTPSPNSTGQDGRSTSQLHSPVAAEGSTHHQGPSPAAGVSQSQMWVPKKGSALGSTSTPSPNSTGQAGRFTSQTLAPGSTGTPSPNSAGQAHRSASQTSTPGPTPPPQLPRTTPSPTMLTPTGRGTQTPHSSAKGTPSSSSSRSNPFGTHPCSSSSTTSRPSCQAPHGSVRSTASSSSSSSTANERAQQKLDADLQLGLLQFLNKFTRDSTEIPFYKAQVAAMKEEGNFKFELNFDHLMERNMGLATDICNAQDRMPELILPVVCQFLSDAKLSDDTSIIYGRLEVKISSMPRSIKSVTKFVHERGGWVRAETVANRRNKQNVATDEGMMVLQHSIAEMFRGHVKDLSWNGNIDIDHFVVINDEEIRITKKPTPGGPASKKMDAQRIRSIFMPKFVLNGRKALYFCILQSDLENVTEEEVTKEWFMEYILAHPALRPSIARYHLVTGIDQTCKKFGIHGSAIKFFLDNVPSWCRDWRKWVPKNKKDVFSKVYHFKFTATPICPEPFSSSNGGLVSFTRNFYQHAHMYLAIQDLSEVEKLGASKFEKAIPEILKTLLRDCNMHNSGPLYVYWKVYRNTTVGVRGSDNTGKFGIYLSYW